ncbi:MAG: hypothetical protein NPIRA02_25970 [Nitrospirales bacterium]|nr:MAG: hypothetical protein NPIRA02_25970 [Nitrospirales bacterium]
MRMFVSLPIMLIVLVIGNAIGFAQDALGDRTNGKAIYDTHCLRCHGDHGEGNGPEASALIVPPTNFQTPESRMKSEFELRSTVIWGMAFSPMHGWFNILDGQEIREVIQYIRQLAPYQAKDYSDLTHDRIEKHT